MLKVNNLKIKYDELEVVHGISFELQENEIFTIVGSNGAGKTSILKAICGLICPSDGIIEFKGIRLNAMSAHKIAMQGISYVPEGRQLFGRLTVLENLLVGSYMPNARKKRKENLRTMFELFPILEERKRQKASTLSGGEQQMLAIARGLMSNPKLIMLDEPSLGIAPVLVDKIFESIKQISREGKTILLVEQNLHRALELANRGIVIQTGRKVTEGSSKELLSSELTKKAYIGI